MKSKIFSLLVLMTFVISGCGGNVTSNMDVSSEYSSSIEPYIQISSSEKESSIDENFSASEDNQIVSLEISEPIKKKYETGDELDLTGLVVRAIYKDETKEEISLDNINISGYSKDQIGKQKITISYLDKTASFEIEMHKKYDEDIDSIEDVYVNDLSDLYKVFAPSIDNYTSTTSSYMNEIGTYDYYRHFQKNYVQDKVSLHLENAQYTYPLLPAYSDIMNKGYINKNNNYYSFALDGNSIEERLASKLEESHLTLVKENASYQDEMFTLSKLNQDYFVNNEFTRISKNKYQTKKVSSILEFVEICAPMYIKEGNYLTFNRVTIEIDPIENVKLRIRLYVNPTQSGKMIEDHKDKENKPNWYMLFSEALITDIGTTTFEPIENL